VSFRETFRYPTHDAPPVTAGARNAEGNKRLLPKEFDRLLTDEDLANLRAIFDTWDVNARGGPGRWIALSFEQYSDAAAADAYAPRCCMFAPAVVARGHALPQCALKIVVSREPGSRASVACRSSRKPIVSLSPVGNHMPAALLPTP